MKGFIYRVGVSIKEFGEMARIVVLIKLGIKLMEAV